MVEQYQLKMPKAVFSGERALSNISKILQENGAANVAVLTGRVMIETGLLEPVTEQIQKAGAGYTMITDFEVEPSYEQAQAMVDACKRVGADFIIAVGGGSIMDSAKLASVLLTDDYGVKDLLDNASLARKSVKTLMIPTTAGTGAEATPNAIVAVPERELKVGIVSDEMIPDYVILDATMVAGMPQKLAAATGIDALAHAIECWTSKKANPFSDLYAMEAMSLILNNILEACSDPDALKAKANMQLASFYAGVAITASGTTAVHALSYPLGGKYHIAHGVSNAILLAPVMRFNAPYCMDRLAEAYDRCVGGSLETREDKGMCIVELLEQIVQKLGIPQHLSQLGVPASDLETLVASGMEVTRLLQNNLRPVTAEDARALYSQVM